MGGRLIFNVNNHAKSARVDIQTNGIISWAAGGADHAWISISGVQFSLNPKPTNVQFLNGWKNYEVAGTPLSSPRPTTRSWSAV